MLVNSYVLKQALQDASVAKMVLNHLYRKLRPVKRCWTKMDVFYKGKVRHQERRLTQYDMDEAIEVLEDLQARSKEYTTMNDRLYLHIEDVLQKLKEVRNV